MFERLYDVTEHAPLHFIGYMTDKTRYDFAIVYTHYFLGKPLVVCMQSGRSAPLCADDLQNPDYLQSIYHLSDLAEAEQLALFLEQNIDSLDLKEPF